MIWSSTNFGLQNFSFVNASIWLMWLVKFTSLMLFWMENFWHMEQMFWGFTYSKALKVYTVMPWATGPWFWRYTVLNFAKNYTDFDVCLKATRISSFFGTKPKRYIVILRFWKVFHVTSRYTVFEQHWFILAQNPHISRPDCISSSYYLV